MANLAETFKNRRVFLTGHTGFKGSWMCVWLRMMGANVKGYALRPETESLYNKIKSQLNIESVYSDIRDKEKLKKEIISFQPDFIFHLAAQPLVRESYNIPVETFETNVIGTANVLDALRFLKKKCTCVIVTTDKVYRNIEKKYAYKETDKLGGYDPYSASKAAAEIITESYRLSFFNPTDFSSHKKAIATARAGNVIGGGDYAMDRIVPDIYRSLSRSRPVSIRNPKAVRPWQHVLDPLNGYLVLAAMMNKKPGEFATSYNFGPAIKDVCTVEELVKLAIKNWGSGEYLFVNNKKAPHEARLLMLDIHKAKRELNWEPKWNCKTAISKTISWYKKSLNKTFDVNVLCEENIREYISSTQKKRK